MGERGGGGESILILPFKSLPRSMKTYSQNQSATVTTATSTPPELGFWQKHAPKLKAMETPPQLASNGDLCLALRIPRGQIVAVGEKAQLQRHDETGGKFSADITS
jgi:hypothetical protein